MRKLVAAAFLCLWQNLSAQRLERPEIDLEGFAERLFQVQHDDLNYEDLYESLLLYYTNPINLNLAKVSELASLFILSPRQLGSFVEYRETNGQLLSIYELQAVPDFDLPTIKLLLPFVTITESMHHNRPLLKRIMREENNYVLLRGAHILEDQRGYIPTADSVPKAYKGDNHRLYGRFRVSHPNDFSLGLTFEKDPGEALAWDKQAKKYGFDFYSYHFYLRNKGQLKALAIGDYQMQFGQGLIYGAGFNPGKGAETVASVKRNTLGVRPYSSVLESGFFRGVAATLLHKNLSYTTFYSRKLQDANLQNDTTFTDFEEYVSSIQNTGFHRTAGELRSGKNLTEQNFGGNITFDYNPLQIGANLLFTEYSSPVFKKPTNYNRFEFKGSSHYIAGIYFHYNWQNFLLFSEAARSRSGGKGLVAGFASSLTKTIDFSMVYRHYDRNFHSFYGNSFGESSRNINEKGIYWGVKYKPSRKYIFAAYYDQFKFPWLKFRTEAPSIGYEYLLRASYTPVKGILLSIQMRQEASQLTIDTEGDNLNKLTDALKNNYAFNIDYPASTNLHLKSRVQWSNYQLAGAFSQGIALIQDVNLKIRKLKISSRWALFDTDDFENRQYTYEKDVLYAFSIPAYNGRGMRNYILLQYDITRKIRLWMRYSRFKFTDRQKIGSGNEAITGNTKTDLKIQMRVKF